MIYVGFVIVVLVPDIAAAAGQGMAGRNGHHHGFAVKKPRIKNVFVEGRTCQPQVQFSRFQGLDLFTGHHFLQVDVDVGKDRRDLLQQGPQDTEPAGRGETDSQKAGAARGDPAGGDRGAFGEGQQPPGFLQEGGSRRGQLDLPVVPFQQLGADGLLQLLDLPAQRRLGHVQAFRRAAEVKLFCHRDESGQLVKGKHDAFPVSLDA